MSLILTLLAALAAAWAHGLLRVPRRPGFRVALRAFAAGSLATAAAFALAARGHLAPVRPLLMALAAAAGLIAWAGLIRLVSFETRKRDVPGRVLCLGLAALSMAFAWPAGVTIAFALAGVMAWRWKRELATRSRFTVGMGALVLGLMLLVHTGHTYPPGSLGATTARLQGFAQVALTVCAWYALLGSLALLRAWVSDPSLGIRTVSRRLALSHVLVGLVPVLLVVGLWIATTVLGVLGERAIAGVQAIRAQERWDQSLLAAALARPAESRARLETLARVVDPAADIRVWQRTGATLERRSGSPVAGESHLVAWLDSLGTLPAQGVMQLSHALYLACATRGPNGGSAVMLTPIDDALRAMPDSVARARLRILGGPLTTRGSSGGRRVGDRAAAADSVMSALEGSETSSDSVTEARIRRSMRRLGMSDSGLRFSTSPRASGVRLSAGSDTFNVGREGQQFLFDGHALIEGLAWRDSTWKSTHFLLVASVPPAIVLSGLIRDARTDRFGLVPLILVGLFTVIAMLVIALDLAMVSGMGGSITGAVSALRVAAARLSSGDLSHRIEIGGQDDLWQVAAAFNTATEGLARAREAEHEQQRIEDELDVARRIQSRLIPDVAPLVRGLEVAGLYNPAREVGGDYYDHIALDDHRVLLVIADVSGKSVPAALIMAGFRAALVSQDLGSCDPPSLAGRLNGFLNDSLDPGKFVTAFLAVVDGTNGEVVYVNAGHNPPVLLRANGSHEMLMAGGTILGILPHSRYERGHTLLGLGDVMVLYTDGVTEGTAPDSELWGDDRLVAAVRARAADSCDDLVCSIAAEVRAFEAERGAADDVTLIAVRRIAIP